MMFFFIPGAMAVKKKSFILPKINKDFFWNLLQIFHYIFLFLSDIPLSSNFLGRKIII